VSDRTGVLLEADAAADPLEQFRRWYAEAETAGIRAPHAVVLATSAPDGTPSARMVLVKDFAEAGFSFFTGYVSRKAGELDANPRAALLFYWDTLGRQVRIEGVVARAGDEESDTYFASRPRGAQLAAHASRQSATRASRDELDARVRELDAASAGRDVPRPAHWGGYRLEPHTYEFWQHRDDRLHDRLRYARGDGGWTLQRLSP